MFVIKTSFYGLLFLNNYMDRSFLETLPQAVCCLAACWAQRGRGCIRGILTGAQV